MGTRTYYLCVLATRRKGLITGCVPLANGHSDTPQTFDTREAAEKWLDNGMRASFPRELYVVVWFDLIVADSPDEGEGG
jgi:hypothetical protein